MASVISIIDFHRSRWCSSERRSFDHLVGSYLQRRWDCKAKCFGGFEVYTQTLRLYRRSQEKPSPLSTEGSRR